MYEQRGKTFYELATDIEFWRNLNPELTVSAKASSNPPEPISVSKEIIQTTKRLLVEEGYFKIENFFAKEELGKLERCVTKLNTEHWPETFAYVYDEFWYLLQKTTGVMAALLGADFKQMPNIWMFYLACNSQSAGWGPHRDRPQLHTLDKNGYPHSINIWLALTDATPENGCIYMLPANLDANYHGDLNIQIAQNYQDIRAVPAKAGDFLGWNDAVFHWGGRSSQLAKAPRISVTGAYQNTRVAAMETPLIDPLTLPSFNDRLGMVAQQFIRFKLQNSYSPLPPQAYELVLELAKLSSSISVK